MKRHQTANGWSEAENSRDVWSLFTAQFYVESSNFSQFPLSVIATSGGSTPHLTMIGEVKVQYGLPGLMLRCSIDLPQLPS
jgi:hypothetical protein